MNGLGFAWAHVAIAEQKAWATFGDPDRWYALTIACLDLGWSYQDIFG